MRKNENNDRLDRAFCKEIYCHRLYNPSFDPSKSRNLEFLPKTYKYFLSRLECFVNELLSNDEIPFLPYLGTDGEKWYTPASLAIKYFVSMPDFIDVVNRLSPKYAYSEPINAFITCCHAMGLLSERLEWRHISNDSKKTDPRFGDVTAAEIFNTLVQAIRSEWKIKNLQAKVNARKQDVADQKAEYCKYADSLFCDRARLVLVRIDLFYEKQYGDSIDVFDMTKDLYRLFNNNARRNSLFAFMIGYIVKLEYGVDKGIHAHVLLFFDGSKRNNSSHIHLAEEIGNYWKNIITKGRGAYWNVNAKAGRYDKLGRLGIGVINWYDTDLRRNLTDFVVSYLCKEDQYFRSKWGPKVKLLRKGDFPEIPVNRRGAPRKSVESYAGLSQILQ